MVKCFPIAMTAAVCNNHRKNISHYSCCHGNWKVNFCCIKAYINIIFIFMHALSSCGFYNTSINNAYSCYSQLLIMNNNNNNSLLWNFTWGEDCTQGEIVIYSYSSVVNNDSRIAQKFLRGEILTSAKPSKLNPSNC